MKFLYRRLALLGAGLAVGYLVASRGHALTDGNEAALRILVLIFSILTGWLLAAITVTGKPEGLYSGNWRIASAHRRAIGAALDRYRYLFYAYLGVLTLALASELCRGLAETVPAVLWLDRVSFGLGAAALIWSAGIPSGLIRVQMETLEDAVQQRKLGDEASARAGGLLRSAKRGAGRPD